MADGRHSIPPCVSQVACYESLQALYAAASAPGGGEPSMVAHGAIGIVAGALAGFLTGPADLVVTRLSVAAGLEQELGPRLGAPAAPRLSFAGVAREVVRKQGWRGLFQGSVERALYHAPLVGFFFFFYESLKAAFGLQALLPSGGI
jgi:hypothetical protein